MSSSIPVLLDTAQRSVDLCIEVENRARLEAGKPTVDADNPLDISGLIKDGLPMVARTKSFIVWNLFQCLHPETIQHIIHTLSIDRLAEPEVERFLKISAQSGRHHGRGRPVNHTKRLKSVKDRINQDPWMTTESWQCISHFLSSPKSGGAIHFAGRPYICATNANMSRSSQGRSDTVPEALNTAVDQCWLLQSLWHRFKSAWLPDLSAKRYSGTKLTIGKKSVETLLKLWTARTSIARTWLPFHMDSIVKENEGRFDSTAAITSGILRQASVLFEDNECVSEGDYSLGESSQKVQELRDTHHMKAVELTQQLAELLVSGGMDTILTPHLTKLTGLHDSNQLASREVPHLGLIQSIVSSAGFKAMRGNLQALVASALDSKIAAQAILDKIRADIKLDSRLTAQSEVQEDLSAAQNDSVEKLKALKKHSKALNEARSRVATLSADKKKLKNAIKKLQQKDSQVAATVDRTAQFKVVREIKNTGLQTLNSLRALHNPLRKAADEHCSQWTSDSHKAPAVSLRLGDSLNPATSQQVLPPHEKGYDITVLDCPYRGKWASFRCKDTGLPGGPLLSKLFQLLNHTSETRDAPDRPCLAFWWCSGAQQEAIKEALRLAQQHKANKKRIKRRWTTDGNLQDMTQAWSLHCEFSLYRAPQSFGRARAGLTNNMDYLLVLERQPDHDAEKQKGVRLKLPTPKGRQLMETIFGERSTVWCQTCIPYRPPNSIERLRWTEEGIEADSATKLYKTTQKYCTAISEAADAAMTYLKSSAAKSMGWESGADQKYTDLLASLSSAVQSAGDELRDWEDNGRQNKEGDCQLGRQVRQNSQRDPVWLCKLYALLCPDHPNSLNVAVPFGGTGADLIAFGALGAKVSGVEIDFPVFIAASQRIYQWRQSCQTMSVEQLAILHNPSIDKGQLVYADTVRSVLALSTLGRTWYTGQVHAAATGLLSNFSEVASRLRGQDVRGVSIKPGVILPEPHNRQFLVFWQALLDIGLAGYPSRIGPHNVPGPKGYMLATLAEMKSRTLEHAIADDLRFRSSKDHPSRLGVEVKVSTSQMPGGNEQLGLFATRPHGKGDLVTPWYGCFADPTDRNCWVTQLINQLDPILWHYAYSVGSDSEIASMSREPLLESEVTSAADVVDTLRSLSCIPAPTCMARFVQSSTFPNPNLTMVANVAMTPLDPDDDQVRLDLYPHARFSMVAIKEIKVGDELFMAYDTTPCGDTIERARTPASGSPFPEWGQPAHETAAGVEPQVQGAERDNSATETLSTVDTAGPMTDEAPTRRTADPQQAGSKAGSLVLRGLSNPGSTNRCWLIAGVQILRMLISGEDVASFQVKQCPTGLNVRLQLATLLTDLDTPGDGPLCVKSLLHAVLEHNKEAGLKGLSGENKQNDTAEFLCYLHDLMPLPELGLCATIGVLARQCCDKGIHTCKATPAELPLLNRVTEPTSDVPIPIPVMLRDLCKTEEVEVKCQSCSPDQNQRALKSHTLDLQPNTFLTVRLKRGKPGDAEDVVYDDFPVALERQCRYAGFDLTLMSVVCFSGQNSAGHYIAYARDTVRYRGDWSQFDADSQRGQDAHGRWYAFDDDVVKPVEFDTVVSKGSRACTVLVYRVNSAHVTQLQPVANYTSLQEAGAAFTAKLTEWLDEGGLLVCDPNRHTSGGDRCLFAIHGSPTAKQCQLPMLAANAYATLPLQTDDLSQLNQRACANRCGASTFAPWLRDYMAAVLGLSKEKTVIDLRMILKHRLAQAQNTHADGLSSASQEKREAFLIALSSNVMKPLFLEGGQTVERDGSANAYATTVRCCTIQSPKHLPQGQHMLFDPDGQYHAGAAGDGKNWTFSLFGLIMAANEVDKPPKPTAVHFILTADLCGDPYCSRRLTNQDIWVHNCRVCGRGICSRIVCGGTEETFRANGWCQERDQLSELVVRRDTVLQIARVQMVQAGQRSDDPPDEQLEEFWTNWKHGWNKQENLWVCRSRACVLHEMHRVCVSPKPRIKATTIGSWLHGFTEMELPSLYREWERQLGLKLAECMAKLSKAARSPTNKRKRNKQATGGQGVRRSTRQRANPRPPR